MIKSREINVYIIKANEYNESSLRGDWKNF